MVQSISQLGKIGFDEETGMYWGKVLHLCETETFFAESVEDLRRLIQGSTTNKQEDSDRLGGISTEPFFESLVICLDPALFLKLSEKAGLVGKSVDEYIVDILEEVVNKSQFLEPA